MPVESKNLRLALKFKAFLMTIVFQPLISLKEGKGFKRLSSSLNGQALSVWVIRETSPIVQEMSEEVIDARLESLGIISPCMHFNVENRLRCLGTFYNSRTLIFCRIVC